MMRCPYCQFENEDGALFCEQCKTDLGVTEPAAAGNANGSVQPLPAEPATSAVAAAVEMPVAEAIPVSEVPAASAFVEAAPATTPLPPTTAAGEPPPAAAEVPPGLATVASLSATHADSALAAPPTGANKFPPGTQPKLLVVRGQRPNVEFPIYEGDNYLGRADEKPVDIDLEDQEAPDRIWSSRQHALISFEDGQLAIEDLNSTNGTFVNRTRVHPGQKRPLQVNDLIQIGTVHLRVKV